MTASAFQPAWWLPGPHSQTLWPFLCHRRQLPAIRWERLELPDGDFLDLAWANAGRGAGHPLCVLLHGLEGSYRSHYMPGLMQALISADWRVVVMHFRGCSGTPNRLPRSYHSGETGDLTYVLDHLRQREQAGNITAVGFSLGGNVLLKYLGECGRQQRDSGLQAACAVSVPFDLAAGAARLNRGLSRLYQGWLVAALRRKIRQKFRHQNAPIDIDQLHRRRSFRDFDHYVTAPLHGFSSADDYYLRSSSRPFLGHICTPTLIIQAADDPFLDPAGLPAADELSPAVTLELSQRGGHVGFVSGRAPWRARYWLEERIPRFMANYRFATERPS